MEFIYEVGAWVRFRRFGSEEWQRGKVVARSFDVVHIYGEDMETCRYDVRIDDGYVHELCVLWDSVMHDNILEELARL